MKISVTEKHIREGKLGNAGCCPVALATKEQAGLRKVCVGALFISCVNENGKYRIAHHDSSVFRLVRRFDDGEPVEPFTFELELENEFIRGNQ